MPLVERGIARVLPHDLLFDIVLLGAYVLMLFSCDRWLCGMHESAVICLS